MRYFYTSELYHHGIKGQRWGVRRYRNEDGSLTKAGRKRYNRELKRQAREKRRYEKRSLSYMSDDELSKRVRRLEMSKRYKDLSRDTSSYQRGRQETVATVAAISGIVATTGAITTLALRYGKIFKK